MSTDADGAPPYRAQGDRVEPTEYARGPWFDDRQHGACVLGLMAHFMERLPSAVPMRFTRITADLSRAVPMDTVTVRARPLRDGRRVQSVEATIEADTGVVARAVGTRIRVEPGLVPAEKLPTRLPRDAAPPFARVETPHTVNGPGFQDRIEVRQLDDPLAENPRTWYRLRGELIAGEVPSPTVRVASLADMIMSSATRLGPGWISINPEVSLQMEREPVGEWLCVASEVRFTDDGIGVSEAVLFDADGRVGRSAKSVLNHRAPEGHRLSGADSPQYADESVSGQ